MRQRLMATGYMPAYNAGFMTKHFGPVFEAPNDGGVPDPAIAAAAAAAARVAAEKVASDAAAAAAALADPNKPTDKEAKLLREVMAQKAALAAKDAELAATAAKFAGIDVEKARAAIANEAAAEEARLTAVGDFTALKARMAAEHQADLVAERAKTAAAAERETNLQKTIRELTVGSAFSGSTFISNDTVLPPDIARVAYDGFFDAENGTVVGYDAPRGTAGRTALVGGSGEPLPFDEALKRIVDKSPNKDKILRSKANPGGGTHNLNLNVNGGERKVDQHGSDPLNDSLSRIGRGLNAILKK